MEMANVTGGVSRGSDRRVADQEYRRRSDAAVRSAENANMKRHRQESRQHSAAEYYEAALIDVSVDAKRTGSHSRLRYVACPVSVLLSKVFHWRTSNKKFYGKSEIRSLAAAGPTE